MFYQTLVLSPESVLKWLQLNLIHNVVSLSQFKEFVLQKLQDLAPKTGLIMVVIMQNTLMKIDRFKNFETIKLRHTFCYSKKCTLILNK